MNISDNNIFEFMTSEWQIAQVPQPSIVCKFRNARARTYFEVCHQQEMNSGPYKYNILLENSTSNHTYALRLCVQDGQGRLEHVQQGLTIEKQVNKPNAYVEFRICFDVFSYNFGNRLFVCQVLDDTMQVVAQTNPFEIIARRHRKRAPRKKNTSAA